MPALARIAVAASFLAGGALMGVPALGHHAPSGWQYPIGCCQEFDCTMLEPGDVKWTADGWLIVATGEVIAFNLAQDSGDLDWHRCRLIASDPSSKTRTSYLNGRPCLYVPQPDG